MEEKRFYYAKPSKDRCMNDLKHPWRHRIPVYRAAPHVWNVGQQDDVAVYLLDSGDGLILIDTGFAQTLYLTLDGIWRAGFDPHDIRKILLSHWHFDHTAGVAALKELSGAEVWLSREDEMQHQKHKSIKLPEPIPAFETDHFYADDSPITLGRFTIRTQLTPGHTLGVTSFFFEDRDDVTGDVFRCAMHGGLGVTAMRPPLLLGRSKEPMLRYVRDCESLAELPVDIVLPSHLNQGNILPNLPEDTNNYRTFIADYAWHDILIDRAKKVKSWYPKLFEETERT